MKSFVFINLLAGVAHYLFQVIAAKHLDASAFSEFSAWLAYLAFAFILASVLHYFSCFLPLAYSRLRWLLASVATPVLVLCLLPMMVTLDLTMIGASAALMACLFAFLSGQAQARLQFIAMASAGALAGLAKLVVIMLPAISEATVSHFALAIVYSYVPGLVLLSIVLVKSGKKFALAPSSSTFKTALISTLLLSSANALFPQFELMLMRETQSAPDFEQFARLSLFYKAIFFGFMIIGQWLLPFQLRGEERATKTLADVRMILMALGLAGAAAILGPIVAQFVLGWSEPPPAMHIFLSCLNMSCLTWLFLLLQGICSQHKMKLAALIWAGVFAVVPAQLILGLNVTHYYFLALALNLLLIAIVITYAGVRHPKPTSHLSEAQ